MRRNHSGATAARGSARCNGSAGSTEVRGGEGSLPEAGLSASSETAGPLAAIPYFLPSRPCGRNASTTTMMRNVPTTAYVGM